MICVSVAEPTAELCLEALKGLDFAEVRIDAMNVNDRRYGANIFEAFDAYRDLHALSPAMTTDRAVDDDTRKRFLMAAIEAGAKYVDIEVQSDSAYRKEIIEKAKLNGCKVIISFHDFQATPEKGEA